MAQRRATALFMALAAFLWTGGVALGQGAEMLQLLDPKAASASTVSGRMAYSWQPLADVRGQDAEFGFDRTDLAVSISPPLGGPVRLSVALNSSTLQYRTSAVFPDTGDRHPPAQWKIGVSAGFMADLGEGKVIGAMLGIGTAADHPFHSDRELTVFSLAYLRLAQGKEDAWLFAVFFGTSGAELSSIPIPVVAYLWKPDKRFTALLGLPFVFVTWNPAGQFRLNFSYFPITSVRAGASLRLGPVSIGADFAVESDAFRVAGIDDRRTRVYHYRARVALSLSMPLFFARTDGVPDSDGSGIDSRPHAPPEGGNAPPPRFAYAGLQLQAGWNFMRFHFLGNDSSGYVDNRFDVADGAFLSAGIQFAF